MESGLRNDLPRCFVLHACAEGRLLAIEMPVLQQVPWPQFIVSHVQSGHEPAAFPGF